MNEIERIEEERFVESLISLWIQPDAPQWIIDYVRKELRKQRGFYSGNIRNVIRIKPVQGYHIRKFNTFDNAKKKGR